jgi:hypothetical protein
MKETNLEPPFIANSFELYKKLITKDNAIPLAPVREFDVMQAFYAGFAEGMNVSSSIARMEPKAVTAVSTMIKVELAQFSKAQEGLAQTLREAAGDASVTSFSSQED